MAEAQPRRIRPLSPAAALACSLVAALLATLIAWRLDGPDALASQAMLYVLAVLATAYWLGSLAANLTALIGVSALNFFFVPPRLTFQVENREYVIVLATTLLVSLAVSGLLRRLQLQTQTTRMQAARATELHHLSEALARAPDEQAMLHTGARIMAGSLGCPVLLLRREAADVLAPAAWAGTAELPAYDAQAARWSAGNAQAMGPTSQYWPSLEAWYLPIPGATDTMGVAVVLLGGAARQARHQDRQHMETLVSQLAGAIQRVRHAHSAEQARLRAEAESVRNAMLASIAHDLRTPLAVIIGASSTVRTQGGKLDASEQERLLGVIEDEAAQMSMASENLLQLARISGSGGQVGGDWESVEEIVGAVRRRFGARDPSIRIEASLEKDLPLVKVDAVLIAQVLGNLLDNAQRHAPGPLPARIEACLKDKFVEVSVLDHGPGIEGMDSANLFSRFTVGPGARRRGGVGLGLAACKAIVEAHGGSIRVQRRSGGGSAFVFTLPVLDQPTVPQEAS